MKDTLDRIEQKLAVLSPDSVEDRKTSTWGWLVEGKVVGSISVGCGQPALADAELEALADRFGAPVEELRREARRRELTNQNIMAGDTNLS